MVDGTTHPEKILVVEDDAALAMGLVHNLRYEGFDVSVARTGDQGLKLACDWRPDLVLLDVMLPGMDGFEVLRSIRDAGLQMRVLMLTARSAENDKIQGLGLGADDYIVKPFSLRELVARVHAALRRDRIHRRELESARIEFADVVVCPGSRTVTRGGVEQPFSSREFDLLLLFVNNPERVFSREDILRAIWGWDYDGTDRTVDNFIRNLRSRLEPDPARPIHFRTVFGAGYSFRP